MATITTSAPTPGTKGRPTTPRSRTAATAGAADPAEAAAAPISQAALQDELVRLRRYVASFSPALRSAPDETAEAITERIHREISRVRAALDEAGTGAGHHLGNAEPAADLDQLAATHDDVAALPDGLAAVTHADDRITEALAEGAGGSGADHSTVFRRHAAV